MPMIWNDAAISKLCCAILATTEVKVDYKKLAEYMGAECTHRAVEFQVQKMKKAEKASGFTDSPSTNTPKSSGKRKASKDTSMDDGSTDETQSKPAKKVKKTMVKDENIEAEKVLEEEA